MKKLLFSLSLLASLATFAGESTVDATAQVFGVLPVYSTASNVIVSVPWVAASNTDTNKISVAEIIKTAGLTAGDWIRSWDPSASRFNVWQLKSGTGGVLYWDPVNTVDGKGLNPGSTSEDTYLKRGDALVLYRQNPTNFYVYGQYKALSSSDATTVAEGGSTTAAYTLIAPPLTSATYDLNSDIDWTTGGGSIDSKDRLVYGESAALGKQYRYVGEKWGYYKSVNGVTSFQAAPALKSGIGFWYVSKGGNPTIKWSK